jgi:hypothetical protein
MSRTREEIFNAIKNAADGSGEDRLRAIASNTSATSIFNLLANIYAIVSEVSEINFDAYKYDIISYLENKQYGKADWYQQKALEFQYGNELTIIDGKPGYSYSDSDAKIIGRCSVNSFAGYVKVKVARIGNPPTQLSVAEFAAFGAYIERIKPAGINVQLINEPSDKILFNFDVYGDILLATSIKESIPAAVRSFLTTIPFNGAFSLSALRDYLRKVKGVTDIVLKNMQWYADSVGIYQPINREVIAISGYYEVSDSNDIDTPNVDINYYLS